MEHDKAIGIYTRLVEQEGRTEFANDLAFNYDIRGAALVNLGEPESAIKGFEKAAGIYTRLVEQEGRTEFANELARSHNNLGILYNEVGHGEEADRAWERAVAAMPSPESRDYLMRQRAKDRPDHEEE